MVHHKYADFFLKKHNISDRVLAIDMKIGRKRIRIISVYLPHAGYSWTDFQQCFDDLSTMIADAGRSNMDIFIGGDFKLSLDIGARGDCMNDFCQQLNLQIANRSGSVDDASNWTFKSSLGFVRRIDFILHGPMFTSSLTEANWDIDLGSDHRCVRVQLSFTAPKLHKAKIGRSMRGWKPEFNQDGTAADFHKNIDIQLDHRAMDNLDDLQSIIHDAASFTASSASTIKNSRRPERSVQLKMLISQRRRCRDRNERLRLSKEIHRVSRQELRAWKSLWADMLLEKFRDTKYFQKINSDPIQSQVCPIDKDEFAGFLKTLYTAEENIDPKRSWDYDLA